MTSEPTSTGSDLHFPRHTQADGVQPSPRFPDVETDVLAFWKSDDTFRASIENRSAGEKGENEFVFYDGPPFANGLPHYGHLLTGYVKDVVPRFQTMLGKRVERRFGWDTHGLPAELEAERILGITDKTQIEEMGLEAFNKECRDSVLRYTKEWEEYVTRQARWVDFENDYKTLDLTYMESVIWAFKQLYDKGLAYEGYRVLPYCWRDETPLSNHELRMDDDTYRMRQDPAITVGFRLEAIGPEVPSEAAEALTGAHLLIWTTTPWTVPSNLATAVHPEVTYAVVAGSDGGRYVLAEARLAAYERELGTEPEVLATLTGAQLAGSRYTPPFGYFAGRENAHQVLLADYVTTDDGTGIVHIAPAYGEEDKVVTDAAGIEPATPVDAAGKFDATVPDYAGMNVFDANAAIIKDLKAGSGGAQGQSAVLLRHETYDHSYPHCWRCKNPLIYRAVSSWFVKVTEFRDRMVELNDQITWVPEHIKDGQFGKWLANARDWSISRNRYWGTPIPVWVSDDPAYPRIDVYGSLADLEADFGVQVTDLHRPFIDELTRANPDDPTGKATMRRIPDVFDVWFDSGSMPFAQVHYPFANADWFENHYPGDFIVEYIGQTRGWFYTLHVLATALFDRPAFRTCVSHGIILGDDGRKASKSLRNFPDPMEMFHSYGSDAVRLSLMGSPVLRGGNLVVAEESIRDQVRQVLLPLWNTWYFFGLYANTCNDGAGIDVRAPRPEELAELEDMDRYVLARTRSLVETVRTEMERYEIAEAVARVREHLDLLTNWYVRTSRQRFWDEDAGAYQTLYTALEVLLRVMAPLAPMVTEEVWRGLTGGRSVHLTDWPVPGNLDDPTAAALVADEDLVTAMDAVRDVVSVTHGLRKANQLRVRQPLRSVKVVVDRPDALAPFTGLVADEVNVKDVEIRDLADGAASEYGVYTKLTVNARAAGPRLGKDVQRAIADARSGAWQAQGERVSVDGILLEEGEFTLTTEIEDRFGDTVAAGVLPGGGFVVLDLELDDELIGDGYARDVVRQVQDARKAADLHVSDRIRLSLAVPRQWAQAVTDRKDFIAGETLAVSVHVDVAPVVGDDEPPVGIDLAKVSS
ncbi:isoleucine--tRNA ligase [Ruania alkalisoli]|uniref:Isoleucine--tRNA ligase n=1 Tax=Ruania alkalisoli TaxID=2779775 RepID=A0A7M1SZG9_9MICO|nr:isoleucine--tRNA ligase [Ruania alkalisoli]QOR72033.1 isoleucine--tRNA ligase [Ruania alkalisoli]